MIWSKYVLSVLDEVWNVMYERFDLYAYVTLSLYTC